MTRIARAAALALVSMLALAGCVKYDLDLTVNSDDTVSGTVVLAVQKGVGEQMGVASDEEALAQIFGEQSFPEAYAASDFAEGDWIGKSYEFENIPLADFAEFGDLFTISREGDTFVVSSESAPMSADDAGSIPDGAESALTITFPGKVTEANGEIDGNSVTWNLFTQTEPMSATAKASAGFAIPTVALLVGGIVLLLVAGGVVTFLVLRKSKASAAAAGTTDAVILGDSGDSDVHDMTSTLDLGSDASPTPDAGADAGSAGDGGGGSSD